MKDVFPPGDIAVEVAVAGGGLVGAVLGVALAEAGVRVAVIEREAPATALAAAYDGRASAVALTAQRALAALALWPHLEALAEPIREIRVSEAGSGLFLHYDHRELGDAPLGWMVENRYLRRAALGRLAGLERAHLLAPAGLIAAEHGADGVALRLADGRRVTAGLLVAADGRGSRLRRAAGIAATRWDYGQAGIVCTVAHERPHGGVAQERFLPAGPFAILPLPGKRSSIVWTERAGLAPAIMAAGAEEFAAELASRFGDHLGALEIVGPRFCWPLSLEFANRYTAPRLALVGDAAHAMHPIAGQGMNMGLRDVAALAEAIVAARRLGLDVGGAAVLGPYQRRRRFDNLLMLAATDGLNRLFSNDLAPLRLARDLGLAAVDRMGPLKRLFMRHAMGLAGELPKLLRGERL